MKNSVVPFQGSGLRKLHRMLSTAKWPKGGPFNDSSSVLLGVDFVSSGPRLSALSYEFGDLIREINRFVCSSLSDPGFVWSSLILEVNSVSESREIPFCAGPALTFVHGKHQGLAHVQGSHVVSHSFVMHDSSSHVSLPSFSGFRVVITLAWQSATEWLSEQDTTKLRTLGFPLSSRAVPALVAPWAEGRGHIIPTGACTRSLIELCCSLDSRLGASCPASSDCARYRFTEQEDLTTASGLRAALVAVHESQRRAKGHLLIWVSIPCTGGCTWNRINKRFPSACAKQALHLDLFHKLWDACTRVMEYAVASGGATLAIEWPKNCDYWGFPGVQEFMLKFGMTLSHFDGCMYGLLSSKGVPLKKPWGVASNTCFLGEVLNLKCVIGVMSITV